MPEDKDNDQVSAAITGVSEAILYLREKCLAVTQAAAAHFGAESEAYDGTDAVVKSAINHLNDASKILTDYSTGALADLMKAKEEADAKAAEEAKANEVTTDGQQA